MAVIGLDLGHSTIVAAEHWLASLPPVSGLVACTHFRGGRPLFTSDGVVRYPGVELMTGARRVDEVLRDSAVERILQLGLPVRSEPPGDAPLDTRSFVRPQWTDGWLTLFAMPTPDGHIAAFEVSNATPC